MTFLRRALRQIIRFSEVHPALFLVLYPVALFGTFKLTGIAVLAGYVPVATLLLTALPVMVLFPLWAYSLGQQGMSPVIDWWVSGLKAFAEGY